MTKPSNKFIPGITLRSLVASILSMLVAGMLVQYLEVILSAGAPAEQVLPVPAMIVIFILILFVGIFYSLTKVRLLTKQEMLCITFSMLLSIPMMTQGTWHRFVGLISVPLRKAQFQYMDAYSDKFYPRGKNLLKNTLEKDKLTTVQGSLQWNDVEYEEGKTTELPQLTNLKAKDFSSISIVVKRKDEERGMDFYPTEPHLLSFLINLKDSSPETRFICRVYEDDSDRYKEIITKTKADDITFLHRKGFVRAGIYDLSFSEDVKDNVRIEIGIEGRGTLSLVDPQFYSVAALQQVFTGKKVVGEKEYNLLTENQRRNLIMKPDNMWSLTGAAYLLSGYIPYKQWVTPAITWSSIMFFIVASFFAVNVIMRKQWAENERYPFPNARIPMAMIGGNDDQYGAFPAVWKNKFMWIGFAVSLLWGLMKGWNFYNPHVPDMNIDIALGPYFSDPGWNGMWNINFTVCAFLLSITIFFELNVLISMVIGYFIYRACLWGGGVTGVEVYSGFPWRYHQAMGAYLGYFFVVIFFTRKYLFRVFKNAIKDNTKDPEDIMSNRSALILLLVCFAGAIGWAKYINVSVMAIFIYFTFLVILGFVCAKFRAECGVASGYFTPYNAMILLTSMGGIITFGGSGILTTLLCSGFLTVTVFFLIPGAQIELIQMGRKMKVCPRHIAYTCLLGLFGGIIIGGWVFLSNAYAIGGDNIRFQWGFNGLAWFFNSFNTDLAKATTEMTRSAHGSAEVAASTNYGTRVIFAFGGISVILTVLRQFFSGFWFHPIGFILGSSHMMDGVWGSVFVAWVIRSLVLAFGGATCVKNKLQPFFVGMFAASIIVLSFFYIVGVHMRSIGVENIYGVLP